MDLLSQAREIDYGNPAEKAIFETDLQAEGLVLVAHDIEWGGKVERQIVGVVAGRDGPELVCARAFPSTSGDMITRVDLSYPVSDACKRFLSSETSPRALSLTPHTDKGIVEAYPGRVTYLWRQGIAGESLHTIYLLRLPSAGGHDLVVASDTVKDGESTVVEHGRVSTTALLEWANETFGVSAPAP